MIKMANPKKLQRTAQTVSDLLHFNPQLFCVNLDDFDNSDLDRNGRALVHHYEERVGLPALEQSHEVGRLRLSQRPHSHFILRQYRSQGKCQKSLS